MASAKAGVHVVQLKPIVVTKSLQDGYKFIKWDDDSGIGTVVTLRVDKKGYFLYWIDQNKETEFLEISSIRDTRTGKYAKVPKADGKLKDSLGNYDDPLEDRTLTVVYGPDLINVNFINFCCNKKEVAQVSHVIVLFDSIIYSWFYDQFVKPCYFYLNNIKSILAKNINVSLKCLRFEHASFMSITYKTTQHISVEQRTTQSIFCFFFLKNCYFELSMRLILYAIGNDIF